MIRSFMGRAALACAAVVTFNTSLFAQTDSTLRQLAEARGRFVGAILNSNWFSYGLGDDAEIYENTHKSQFNIVVAENEMKFDATEPKRNSFSFSKGDKLMAYAAKNGMQVRGHALAWHSQVPQWVPELAAKVEKEGGSAKDTLLTVLKNHIENVVGHYKGKIREWDVVNEAIDDTQPATWRSGSSQNPSVWCKYIGREFIDSAFTWAHQADPDAKLYYNDYSLEWGLAAGSKAQFAVDSIGKRLKAAGIYITGIGTQTHISNYHETTPQNVQALVKALEAEGLTMQITELDIGFDKKDPTQADFETQGHLYRQFMDIFLEAPNTEAFVIWGFSDKYSWLADQYKYCGLIFDSSFAAKPAYDSLVASLKAHSADKVTKITDAKTLTWENSSAFGNATYVIVDYSQTGAESRGEWSGDVTNGNAKFVGEALAGKTGYMNVPLAGCDQNADYCGYQHAVYTLPQDVVDSNILSKCETLLFTTYGTTGSTAYVNVGMNEPWVSLQNGRPVASKVWSGMTVDLQVVRDSSFKPTQLTINSSDLSALYIAKIEAVGCPDSNSVPVSPKDTTKKDTTQKDTILALHGNAYFGSLSNISAESKLEIFDMQGRYMGQVKLLHNASIVEAVQMKFKKPGAYLVRSGREMRRVNVK